MKTAYCCLNHQRLKMAVQGGATSVPSALPAAFLFTYAPNFCPPECNLKILSSVYPQDPSLDGLFVHLRTWNGSKLMADPDHGAVGDRQTRLHIDQQFPVYSMSKCAPLPRKWRN